MTDYSTLNIEELRKLPDAHEAIGNRPLRISDQMGSGCLMDPPGYPTYFLQHVYTKNGNEPKDGPNAVIDVSGVGTFVTDPWKKGDSWDTRTELLRRLWSPLPEAHPRVQAWISVCYSYFNHCYRDLDALVKPFDYGRTPAALIYPLPSYDLKHFHDDPRFSEEWRTKERAAVEVANADLRALYARVCIPERHSAVLTIREYYPEHVIREDWIAEHPGAYGAGGSGAWWEIEAERPTPENCRPRSCGPHPVNKTWCQWCGWKQEEDGGAK